MYSRIPDKSSGAVPVVMSSSRSGRGVLLGRNAEITDMLQLLTKKNNQLERNLGKIGTSADTGEFREILQRTRLEATNLCKRLFEGVKSASLRYNTQHRACSTLENVEQK